MRKDDLNMHAFQKRNWYTPKSDRWAFFSNFDCQRTFPLEYFKWKRYGGTGLLSKKTEVLYAELNKTAEAALILQQAIFTPYIYFVIMAKNHQKIRSRCLDHEFSFKDIFKDIRHGYKAA